MVSNFMWKGDLITCSCYRIGKFPKNCMMVPVKESVTRFCKTVNFNEMNS